MLVHLHSWLYNLFDDFVEGKIKDALNQRVCDLVSEKIKKTANEALATFPGKCVY